MKTRLQALAIATFMVFSVMSAGAPSLTAAQDSLIPASITTPDKVETRIGTLDFTDGYPTPETASTIRDELNYLHGIEAFMNSIQGVSLYALRKGYESKGIKDNEFLIFPKLMDSNSLFLTANADTVYFWGNLNLKDGPLVMETPPMVLGIFDDFWFRWVGDFGLAGPDKGQGGKYLIVGPDYDGPLPDDGYFVYHSRTNLVTVLFRAFLEDDDPAPAAARVKETTKLYPYVAGGYGTSIGSYLNGKGQFAKSAEPKSARFINASGMVINTVPPNDFGHYELLNEMVQREPASALDPEIAGQFAAIGIVKGKEFNPDERMKKILTQAVAFGNAASRTLGMGAHPDDSFRFYEDSAWWNMLFDGGYQFMDPPPFIGENGEVKPAESAGARLLHSRTSMFYTATGITPAMCMRLTGIGSQYLIANVDADNKPFDGAKTYRLDLPKDIPAERFWSLTVYDNQSRSMLATPQKYPRAGSQNYPSPKATPNADGSTTIYFGPEKPSDAGEGNWIQTDSEKGWFTILRLYSPLQPFFEKSWRPGEFEEVK
jgi:hypothetical protein